jgi:hypothetical protein
VSSVRRCDPAHNEEAETAARLCPRRVRPPEAVERVHPALVVHAGARVGYLQHHLARLHPQSRIGPPSPGRRPPDCYGRCRIPTMPGSPASHASPSQGATAPLARDECRDGTRRRSGRRGAGSWRPPRTRRRRVTTAVGPARRPSSRRRRARGRGRRPRSRARNPDGSRPGAALCSRREHGVRR